MSITVIFTSLLFICLYIHIIYIKIFTLAVDPCMTALCNHLCYFFNWIELLYYVYSYHRHFHIHIDISCINIFTITMDPYMIVQVTSHGNFIIALVTMQCDGIYMNRYNMFCQIVVTFTFIFTLVTTICLPSVCIFIWWFMWAFVYVSYSHWLQ